MRVQSFQESWKNPEKSKKTTSRTPSSWPVGPFDGLWSRVIEEYACTRLRRGLERRFVPQDLEASDPVSTDLAPPLVVAIR